MWKLSRLFSLDQRLTRECNRPCRVDTCSRKIANEIINNMTAQIVKDKLFNQKGPLHETAAAEAVRGVM